MENFNLILQSSAFNRHGALLLASGQENEALQAFSNALLVITKILDKCECNRLKQMYQTETNSNLESLATNPEREQSNIDTSNVLLSSTAPNNNQKYLYRQLPIPTLRDELIYVYNEAFIYHLSKEQEYNDHDIRFQSSIILFNMALLFHNRGVTTPKTALLQKACQLYEECQKIMQEYDQSSCIPDGTVNHLLLLGVLNNRVQISYKLCGMKYKELLPQLEESAEKYGEDTPAGILVNISMLHFISHKNAPSA